jgi:hypothetical protein
LTCAEPLGDDFVALGCVQGVSDSA